MLSDMNVTFVRIIVVFDLCNRFMCELITELSVLPGQ